MSSALSLPDSLKQTLAYFDIARVPLTKEELYAYLWNPPQVSYQDFVLFLEGEATQTGLVAQDRGFYFLPGRQQLVGQRQEMVWHSEKKLKIARRAARLIRAVPFVKAIFVCNTVGAGQASEQSDIDFLIITAYRRIWIARLLVTGILQIFGLRRTKKNIKNKICLSFYLSEKSLDLAGVRVADDDIHFAFWIHQMLPVFDPGHIYDLFLQANSWTKKYLPHISVAALRFYARPVIESVLGSWWKRAWETMWAGGYGDLINQESKKIQLSKMKFSSRRSEPKTGTGVVISDDMLKFHEEDTRLRYRQEWLNRI
jgi:hypothetical protein